MGRNAKERKALRGAWLMSRPRGARAGAYGPATHAPPPPLCNRVGNCTWGSGGSQCRCDLWPQWIHNHGIPFSRAVALPPGDHFADNVGLGPLGAAVLSVQKGTTVSYYRPSGTASW